MIYYYYLSPSSLEDGPYTNVTVIDLLTGTLVQKVVPEDEPAGVYPLGDILLGTGRNLWELNLDSQKITVVGGKRSHQLIESINSYRKAQDFYEKKGNETQSRKMQDQKNKG